MATASPSSTLSRSILLVNPPSPSGLTANREGSGGLGAWSAGDAGFLYPPQTLACCAAILRAAGWPVRILDAAGERLSALDALARVKQESAAVVVLLVAQISLDVDVAFLNQVRAALPTTRLLAIGTSMPFVAPILLERTDVDHVLLGEPEAMLPPVCRALAGESLLRLRRKVTAADVALPGADGDGRLENLDSLPFPAWDLIPRQRYSFLTLLASRGCDDSCAFCPYVVGQGRHFRPRRPEPVVTEMEWLATTFRPQRVIVRDPVFAHDRARVEEICRLLIARRVKLAWECESRPEHFDADLVRLLKRAGCITLKLGFETTSDSVLRALHRIPATASADPYLEHTADVVAACRAQGMACRLFVMAGLPGQTDADVAATITYLGRVQPTEIHVKAFHRYPGLPMVAADLDEERQRGERQAAILQEAAGQLKHTPAPSALHTLRRWLRQRVRP